MHRRVAFPLIVLAGFAALMAPAVPALTRYVTPPQHGDHAMTLLLAGVTPKYAPTPPWPALPEDFTGATDSLILAQIHPEGTIHLLSIPRDTWTNLPGHGWHKINAANPLGGPDLLIQAVQRLTDLSIDGYVLLSLSAIRAVTDASGGVILDVPRRMKYDDQAGHLHIDLQPGRQHLKGVQVEGFLRFRKDGLGDIGRVQRQQLYLSAFVSRLKNPIHWWRLPAVLGAVDRNTKMDLTRAEAAQLFGAALSGVTITTHLLPGNYGRSTWVPDHAAIQELVHQTFQDPNDPRSLRIMVVNVGAPAGSARRLKTKLKGLGYRWVEISTGEHQESQTTVTGSAAAAVLDDVGYGQVTQAEGVAEADITVFLGSDTPSSAQE